MDVGHEVRDGKVEFVEPAPEDMSHSVRLLMDKIVESIYD